MAEREITTEWIEHVLRQPARVEEDSGDPSIRHALARITEREGRVLRVVYNWTSEP